MYLGKLLRLSLLATIISILGGVVRAETLSDEQMTNYAQVLMQIESNRQQAYRQIQEIMGQEPPEITCNQPSSYNNLPEDAVKVVIDYCQTSEQIVTNQGMTVEEFNQITQQIQQDQELEQRLQEIMKKMQ